MKRLFLLALVAAWLAPTQRASACGGLFCNQLAPVVQSSERIVFVDNGDGTITAVIEIVYSGPSTSFSWVLPVSGVPAVEVASTVLLPTLSSMTQPTLQATFEGSPCTFDSGCSGCACGAASDSVRSGGSDAGMQPGVVVVGSGSAGPYDYDVISIDSGVSNQADTARTWLMTNGYDVSTVGADVLGAYLEGGQNLIAFRLKKSATTGSIRPIVMTYTSTIGVIPIRPTAVAAQNDLGILVFMMGGSRAVPVTYDEIELSEAALDWTQFTSPYTTVVGDAVDEADGHAFLTEFAGMLSGTGIDLNATEARAAHQSLVAQPTLDGWALVAAAVDALDADPSGVGFATPYDGLVDALVEGVPNMTAASAASYISFPAPRAGVPIGFDRAAFLDALDRYVVAPREVSEDIANRRPYVTRLFTTIDPAEMTVDPVFAFASGLPTVAAARTATVTQACVNGTTTLVRVDLDDGTGFDPRRLDPTTPKVLRRIDYDLDGSHVLVTDNTAVIAAALHDARPRASSSCSMDDGSAASALLQRTLFALVMLLAIRAMRPRRA